MTPAVLLRKAKLRGDARLMQFKLPMNKKMKKGFKVALALGGGGVRGLSHIGIIKILVQHSIPIDLVVGTSMGAIVGATFCLRPDILYVEQKILELVARPQIRALESLFLHASEENQKKFMVQKLLSRIKNLYVWNLRAARKWLVRTEPIAGLLRELFHHHNFSDTQIPFACVAVDLNSASDIIMQKGKILEAIIASSAIPGVFPPFKSNNQLLVDGGVLSLIPVKQARILGADFVIGVDLSSPYSEVEPLTGLDVMFQADNIKSDYINQLNLKYCDCLVKPQLGDIHWSVFSKGRFCIQQGESATLSSIEEIKLSLAHKRRFYPIKRLFAAGMRQRKAIE